MTAPVQALTGAGTVVKEGGLGDGSGTGSDRCRDGGKGGRLGDGGLVTAPVQALTGVGVCGRCGGL